MVPKPNGMTGQESRRSETWAEGYMVLSVSTCDAAPSAPADVPLMSTLVMGEPAGPSAVCRTARTTSMPRKCHWSLGNPDVVLVSRKERLPMYTSDVQYGKIITPAPFVTAVSASSVAVWNSSGSTLYVTRSDTLWFTETCKSVPV